MSASDPVGFLSGLDRPAAPRPEFAERLLARLLAELTEAAPSRPRRRLPLPRFARIAFAAAVLLLAFAAIATATYLAVRSSAPRPAPAGPAVVTVIAAASNGAARIIAVEPGGRTRTLWRCPGNGFCGDLSSVAWSPDGKRLAFTLDEVGGRSPYVGLHILDLASGKDLHIPSLPPIVKNLTGP